MKVNHRIRLFYVSVTLAFVTIFMYSCTASQPIKIKPGALLWGENCVRCHNAPSPSAFSDNQWDVIGKHMRVRANLTADEVDKIIEFLKMAN